MIYVNKNYDNIFFVNLKCGFSSFESMVKQNKIFKLTYGCDNDILNRKILENINTNCNYWLVLRCPYKRFLSFFNDKFIQCFINSHIKKSKMQQCHFSMTSFYDKNLLENGLLTIDNILNAMKLGYKDIHIDPQTNIIKYALQFTTNLQPITLTDINKKSLHFFQHPMPHLNITNNVAKNKGYVTNLTEKQKNFLYDYYSTDFKFIEDNKLFSYST